MLRCHELIRLEAKMYNFEIEKITVPFMGVSSMSLSAPHYRHQFRLMSWLDFLILFRLPLSSYYFHFVSPSHHRHRSVNDYLEYLTPRKTSSPTYFTTFQTLYAWTSIMLSYFCSTLIKTISFLVLL